MKALVLGGARSGKSEHAERLLAGQAVVHYVATGPPPGDDDPDWRTRVARHRARRPRDWATVESTDLVAALRAADDAGAAVLIDDLGLWATTLLDRLDAWELPAGAALWEQVDRELQATVDAWAAFPHPTAVVTPEVGLSVVPATKPGRVFRDVLGTVNRLFADRADTAWLVVAGMPLRLR